MQIKDYATTSFCDLGVKGGYWTPSDFCPWNSCANKNAPFDQEMFLILNNAVGGVAGGATGYFPDGIGK
jgi:hypothetical protein